MSWGRSWKNEGENYKGICKCPINGTVNGCSVNEQNQQEADSMRVRDTEETEI